MQSRISAAFRSFRTVRHRLFVPPVDDRNRSFAPSIFIHGYSNKKMILCQDNILGICRIIGYGGWRICSLVCREGSISGLLTRVQ